MKRKLVIATNRPGSAGQKSLAQRLSEKLGYKVWRVRPERIRNRPNVHFKQGASKPLQYRLFKELGIPTVEWTNNPQEAVKWLAEGEKVLARTILNGTNGDGITVVRTVEEMITAPLYVKYFQKQHEYRVHVFRGKVVDIQEKRKRKGTSLSLIRNLANGYVFCRENVTIPDGAADAAIRATKALGYDVGGVDVIYNEKTGKIAILEVNASPGMEGSTLESYANAIIGG